VPRTPWLVLACTLPVLLAVAGCSDADEGPLGGSAAPADRSDGSDREATSEVPRSNPGAGDAAAPPAADPPPRTCRVDGLETDAVVDLRGGSASELSRELVGRGHRCADTVVVAADDTWSATLAVAVATAQDAPLLLLDPASADLDDEPTLRALRPASVVTVAVSAAEADFPSGDLDLRGDDPLSLGTAVLEHLGTDRPFVVDPDDHEARLAALTRQDGEVPVLPLPLDEDPDDGPLATAAARLPGTLRAELVASDPAVADDLADRLVAVGVDAEASEDPLWPDRIRGTVWLVDPGQGPAAAAVAAAAGSRDEQVLPVHADDLRRSRDRVDRFVDAPIARTVLAGELTDDVDWQLPSLLEGPRLPTGGLTLFEHERLVALYGTPSSTVLGALGEQDLDAAVERAREVAAPYATDGREVVPTFEMIVTIASAEAGDRGDYSRRLDPDTFRPWIDRARDEGFHVLLDLQPGRTDFLSQAKEYEELLREPHVGLALDPEWRLEDDQVHLRQIGSVDAAEVQQVADWLAELVREHRLPQKLLVLHQFRFSMLPDRDEVVAPPELAVVVHMDGQGPIGTKYETYDAITAGHEDRWWWGWKNFYDEDDPTPTPEQVLDLDPLPVFVSYQ
jgi:hypothetical protein